MLIPTIKTKKHLIISPDSILHNLPFEAILINAPSTLEQPDYLINHYSISYVQSSYIYYSLKEYEVNNEEKIAFNMLLVADPEYQSDYLEETRTLFNLDKSFGRLKYSLEEAKNIIGLKLYKIDQLIGENATEEKIKKLMLNDYDIIHFAAHCLVNINEPGLSGLLLIPGNSNEDGLLQFYEIEKYNIKAKLVFLSACNSISGKVLAGEGMIGLSTSFMHAGALGVVGTIWFIDDYSTSLLVQKYYSELAKNYDYALALKNAQLSLIKNPKYSHPYYWATFRLIGLN